MVAPGLGNVSMQTLSVRVFGGLEVTASGHSPVRFPTRKCKSLLGFLVVRRQRRSARSSVAGELWPETSDERAQRALNTELWRLRSALRDHGVDPALVIDADHETLRFKPHDDVWVDFAVFEEAVRGLPLAVADREPEPGFNTALAEAVALHRGDLLEGVFDEWCLVQREACRAQLIAALEHLVQVRMVEQQWDQAMMFGQRLLEIDPLLEHVHRELMRCHFIRGNRPAAMRQYAACAATLRRELRVEPMDETRRLYETMIAVSPGIKPAPARLGSEPLTHPDRAPVEKIDLALSNLYAAQGWLEDAGRALRRSDR